MTAERTTGALAEGRPSFTALLTAMVRATHTRLDRPTLINDPWGDILVPETARAAFVERVLKRAGFFGRWRLHRLGSTQAIIDAALRATPAYGGVIIRQRYTEDALADAVARGAAQYVILGAGFDSFALRQPAFAKGIQIFEVDHPATQQLKRRQIEAAGIAAPPNVHFFDADLSREPLSAALDRGNYRRTAVSFVAWLGVTMYLPREANLLTLKAVAQCSAFGSEIVFTYIEQQAFDHPSRGFDRLRASAAALGEPWLSGFDPETLAADLKGVGLTLVEDLDSEDMMERYCRGRTDGLRPGTSGRIARARVGLIPV